MSDQRMELADLWHHLNQVVHDRFRPVFRGFNLPPMTVVLLRQVSDHPGITVSELARRAESAKSYVSRIVDNLVVEGYLERRPDPSDQRLIRLYPTNLAEVRLNALEAQIHETWAEVTAGLTEEEIQAVINGFRLLLRAFRQTRKRSDLPDPPDPCNG